LVVSWAKLFEAMAMAKMQSKIFMLFEIIKVKRWLKPISNAHAARAA
jgi:hypothetical protein